MKYIEDIGTYELEQRKSFRNKIERKTYHLNNKINIIENILVEDSYTEEEKIIYLLQIGSWKEEVRILDRVLKEYEREMKCLMNEEVTNLECSKEFIMEFKGRKFLIESNKDMIRFLRLQDKLNKKRRIK